MGWVGVGVGVLVGVEVGVGVGVGVGVTIERTVMLPVMPGWNVQWYGFAPGVSKVCEKLAPGDRPPESQSPASLVTVWAMVSPLIQVTVVPGSTVSDDGV